MTTTDNYVTHAELELVMAHLDTRLVGMEARLKEHVSDKLSDLGWKLIALILGCYGLVIGTIVAVVFFGLNILSKLPAT